MRKHRLQYGVALIELALSIPLMIMLSMIVIEFGRALYEYNTVTKSVRDAVRYLTVQLPPAPTSCPSAATKLVRYGSINPLPADKPLVPGLANAAISCTWQASGTVTVTVSSYRFQSMVSNVFGLQLSDANGGINFGNIAATMRMPT
ncbi:MULTISPECIES: TadE/TadG family type IV pilus assembly protein [Comamonas]|uniref:TadE/TadG family type IV pilus assembly protein n=1 Tax=Comamonas TaxID=283 RepID=UPI00050F86A5|nr:MULTISPECIES: TadE/TadG family type IV pilus assembly protein [Comamonas]KGG91870.1 pilus assembly protein TadE [Comamonas thiooxydans]KGG95377.1 pilus assembly protein TadE [Comamonas thiooxydans]KGH07949.1 pilus assembly protein TadE [Comamonas thiooxydans]KGH15478.1 pilus assembly protein TadE [Comamonas thiooxydans]TZG07218.1 pilus assembly protein [Comamonas thiooxydans]